MKKIGIFIILATFFLPTIVALAADDLSYTVLAPLPCIDGSGTPGTEGYKSDCTQTSNETTLEKYLPGVFKLAIGLSAVFAVLMIVIGGFQYISSDAIMKKSEGKERIKNAVFGLVLVISAWLILNTINPNLLEINLNIESVSTKGVDGGLVSTAAGKKLTEEEYKEDLKIRNQLGSGTKTGVQINKGACVDRIVDCTNVVGLPQQMITSLKDLNDRCDTATKDADCLIMITGGTETAPHDSHGPGKSIVDLRPTPELNKFISKENPTSGTTAEVKVFNNTLLFKFEATGEGKSTGAHWHVIIK